MANLEDLRDVYERFCAFGSTRNLSSIDSLTGSGSACTMEGAKWAKFCRDSGIIDGKKISSTDIDIIFNKVKARGARRMDWTTFLQGVEMLASKRYPEQRSQEALNSILYDVCIVKNGPTATSVTAVQSDAVLERLTNTNGFTGTHRFSLTNRSNTKLNSLSGSNTKLNLSGSNGQLNKSTTQLTKTFASQSMIKRPALLTGSEERLDLIAMPAKKNTTHGRRASQDPMIMSPTMKDSAKQSVFDRLTNTNDYTGSHKLRFNPDGTGRGLAGRDSNPKQGYGVYRGGDVKDLSQILRN